MENEKLISLSAADVRNLLERIIETGVPLRRKKKDGQFSFIPPEDFDQYLKRQDMDFYIEERSLEVLKSSQPSQPLNPQTIRIEPREKQEDPEFVFEPDNEFKSRIDKAKDMSIAERIQTMADGNVKLKSYAAERSKFNAEIMNETGKIFSDSLCINKATLEENMSTPHGAEQIRQLVKETYELINNLLGLLAVGKATFRDLAQLNHIQTGSGSLDHMNRMLIRFISFLFFYNAYFQKYSNEVKRFRAHFQDKFSDYYNKITNGSQRNSLEIVFKDGIAPVKDRSTFIEYCMSGLMHDIGKIPSIDYHDSSDAYDKTKATRHVFDGYNMLIMSKQFSMSTLSTALLHHDYYGAPYGYNQLATFQSRFEDRRREQRNISVTKYFISYNILDVGYNNSLSYFPVKILEMLDVFDAMTDENKKYRKKSFSTEEAVKELRIKYIEGAHLGVDPILYNIFVDFLHVSGNLVDPGAVEHLKI